MNATELARGVVDLLLAAGMDHAVVAPGSRNAPLSFALFDAAEAGALTLHTRIDERTAGFLALGLARAGHRPVAVVTTSGTAAANLHPAVLEAAHSHVPLVAVTADRPARLRGTLANQTTDQRALFGGAATSSDVATLDDLQAVRLGDGPVQLNVQFDGVLTPSDRYRPHVAAAAPAGRVREPEHVVALGPRTVVVAGDDAGRAARQLGEAAGWPVLAEPSSGSRTGAHAIRGYRLLLDTPLAGDVQRVVVLGTPTLSRPVQALLSRPDVEVLARTMPGRWRARPHPVSATFRDRPRPAGADDPDWLRRWQAADAALCARLDDWVAAQPELTPYAVAAEVAAALPPHGLLVVGSSNPIRDLDVMAPPYPVGERRYVLANRGLAGIDGTVSTAIGATIVRTDTRRALAYVGDVTFLHDLNGLLIGPGEQRPDLTVVVANDDGGSIFATLEQGDPAHADAFEKIFGTPHHARIGDLCRGYGVPHRQVDTRAGLARALATPSGGIEVVEARIDRTHRRDLDAALRALATS